MMKIFWWRSKKKQQQNSMETPREQPWVAVLTPTRGMIFTQVIEYVENVRSTYPRIRHFLSHDLPIPDCFEAITSQALADPKYEYFWYIEEDTIPPEKTLDKCFAAMADFDIACVDYGFNGGWNTIVRSSLDKNILFTGFGCTFMKRKVLESFDKPIFKADKAFNISAMQWYGVDPYKVYGMYDIRFGSEARKKGCKFTQVEGECTHLQLLELGNKEVNDGRHKIGEKDHIYRKLELPIADL